MKSAVIASVLACFAFCVPLISGAEESLPEGTQVVQTQSDTQSGNTDKPDEGTQTKLEEIVVTATLIPTPAKELPVPVQVISRKEIEESRANDLAEVLTEYLPEHFQTYPGALSSVSIRGFSSDTTGTDIKGQVLVLIDGHRAGTGNVAEIPLENVERIEIVRGPGSVVYGSAAMGGVVNIITRKGQGPLPETWGSSMGAGIIPKGTQVFRVAFLDNRVGVSLTGRTITQGSYDTGGGARVPNTGYNDQAYSASFFLQPQAPITPFLPLGTSFKPGAWELRILPICRLIL